MDGFPGVIKPTEINPTSLLTCMWNFISLHTERVRKTWNGCGINTSKVPLTENRLWQMNGDQWGWLILVFLFRLTIAKKR